MGFQFRARRARRPQHALHAEPRRQHFAQDRWRRGIGGKERKKIRREDTDDEITVGGVKAALQKARHSNEDLRHSHDECIGMT